MHTLKNVLKLFFILPFFCFVLETHAAEISDSNPNLPKADFIDVASWQGNLSVDDYLQIKKVGVQGVVVKLTEGTNYINPFAKTQIDNAKEAGLKVSVYHYSRYKNVHQAEKEANYFFSTAMNLGINSDTLFVNDAEDSDLIRNPSSMIQEARVFRNTLTMAGIKNVDIYMSESWTKSYFSPSDVGSKGWIASYPYSLNAAQNWHSSSNGWQWSSSYQFSGISGKLFDVNTDYTGLYTRKSSFEENNNTESESTDSEEILYIVRPGDCLSAIAMKYNTGWNSLAHINGLSYPHTIYPGDELKLFSRTNAKQHIVKKFQTLSEIALIYRKNLSELLFLNPQVTNANLIYPGQVINI